MLNFAQDFNNLRTILNNQSVEKVCKAILRRITHPITVNFCITVLVSGTSINQILPPIFTTQIGIFLSALIFLYNYYNMVQISQYSQCWNERI